MKVILSKDDKNNVLDIPIPIYRSRPTNENQSRNPRPSVDYNTPDIFQKSQFAVVTGVAPHETSELEVKGDTHKNQEKGIF